MASPSAPAPEQWPATAPSSGPDPPPERTVLLISSDKKKFKVPESAVVLSQTLKHTVEDLGDACTVTPIPVVNVDGKTLTMVLVYCMKHADPMATEDDLKKFDARFVNKDQMKLRDLMWAANYLDVKGLLDILCQRIADMMAGKKPNEIRELFGIENDFTPEEYQQVYDENKWAFEDL